jgi:hypothetical protein
MAKQEPFDCRKTECPDYIAGNCRRKGVLKVRIPALDKVGIHNPFEYYLSGKVAGALVSTVEGYSMMIEANGLGYHEPLFTLLKTQESRPFPMKQDDGTMVALPRMQWVPRIIIADLPSRSRLGAGGVAVAGQLTAGDDCEDDDEGEEVGGQVIDVRGGVHGGREELDLGVKDDAGAKTFEKLTPDDDDGDHAEVRGARTAARRTPAANPHQQTLPAVGSAEEANRQMNAAREAAANGPAPAKKPASPKTDVVCAAAKCGRKLTENEVAWCKKMAADYDGKFYCFTHQKEIQNGGAV